MQIVPDKRRLDPTPALPPSVSVQRVRGAPRRLPTLPLPQECQRPSLHVLTFNFLHRSGQVRCVDHIVSLLESGCFPVQRPPQECHRTGLHVMTFNFIITGPVQSDLIRSEVVIVKCQDLHLLSLALHISL